MRSSPQKTHGEEKIMSVDPIEANILNFIERMDAVREDPDIEDALEWNYSQDSAVWYLEAAINYKYSGLWLYEGGEEYSNLYETDSSASVISSTNGYYNIAEIQEAYDDLESSLETQYNSIEDDGKFFVMSDISSVVNNLDELIVSQLSVIGLADKYIPNGDWRWGGGAGRCDNTYIGLDATDAIETQLAINSAMNAPSGYRIVYLSIAPINNQNGGWIYPNDYPLQSGQTNPTPYEDYLIFQDLKSPYLPGPCLSASEINWYVENIQFIEDDVRPSNKVLVFNDIMYDQISHMYGDYPIFHRIQPFYSAISIEVPNEQMD
jgi:hypothetical protein